ncbi:Glutamine-Leucine-Glutamine, QLQ [Dillenia turbinata]|uniref:Growth-regulating factor n=1 Tax=Dillenia turbinata TaxID=194707 RepID=A0AAN8V3N5_9MAGN
MKQGEKMMVNHHRPFSSSLGTEGGGGDGAGDVASVALQPLHSSATTHNSPFKSPVETKLGFPFTEAQMKELERQAMIYKYMMFSVPVPPHLLLDPDYTSMFKVGMRGGDAEPGRCKRTDGKKWRCSRDVAPNQKYCERHLNRGRPRSRKPVELHVRVNNKKTRHPQQTPMPVSSSATLNCSSPLSFGSFSKCSSYEPLNPASASASEGTRCMDWMMKREIPQMGSMGFSDSSECQEETFNLNSDLCPFFNTGPEPRRDLDFVDAWSNPASEDDNTGRNRTISFTLSMMNNSSSIEDEEMGKIEMDLGGGVTSIAKSGEESDRPISGSSWFSPGLCVGGPLAEVLQPNAINWGGETSSNVVSPLFGNDDHISTLTTTVSDSSGNSSPTFASTTTKPEIVLQWLN